VKRDFALLGFYSALITIGPFFKGQVVLEDGTNHRCVTSTEDLKGTARIFSPGTTTPIGGCIVTAL